MNTELMAKGRSECVSGGEHTKSLWAKIEGDICQIIRGVAKLGKKLKADPIIYFVHGKTGNEGIYTIKFKSNLRPEKLKEVADTLIFAAGGIAFLLLDQHQIKLMASPDNEATFKAINSLSKSIGPSAEFQPGETVWLNNNTYDTVLNGREIKGEWSTVEIFVPRMPVLE